MIICHDEIIKQVFFTTRLKRTVIRKFEKNLVSYPYICEYLKNRYEHFHSYRDTLIRIYDNGQERTCKYCGISIPYTNKGNFCCKEHKSLSAKEVVKRTCIERYGVDNVAKVKEFINKAVQNSDYVARQKKIKETCKQRYGVDNILKTKEVILASHTKEVIEKQKGSRKSTCIKRYGVDNVSKLKKVKDKIKETCNQRYGVDNVFQLDDIKKKSIKTCIEKYGTKHYIDSTTCRQSNINIYNVPYIFQSDKFKEQSYHTCIEKYGVKYPSQSSEIKKKSKETCIKRYGVPYVFQADDVKKKSISTCIEKYGVEYPSQSPEIQEKVKDTCIEKYGVEYPMQLPEVRAKAYNTKRENGTFNTSKTEDDTYKILKDMFGEVLRQYSSNMYPYNCDFYIPTYDLYIECNYHWTHQDHIYDDLNQVDKNLVESMHSKCSKYYDNAIYTWTIRDKEKYDAVIKNKLNYIVFYSFNQFQHWALEDLHLSYSKNFLLEELNRYKYKPGNLAKHFTNSKIIKEYQQNTLYKKENELWRNPSKKVKLTLNRQKYISKMYVDMSDEELLNGFKLSHIYYGYSHFNPMWFKWFIEKYNVKTCYDPCGGWGHRLLGAQSLDLYIYNDLSNTTYKNVNRIIYDFNIMNTVTYCNDATTFRPLEKYEAMFTCPPYYNIESYECGDFSDIEEYYKLIDGIFDCYYKNDDCRIFGIVIREDLLQDKYNNYTFKQCLSTTANHMHKNNKKKFNEYLYVYIK